MFKNFLKLFSGNAVAQMIQFVALYVLMNIYAPDSFGRLGNIQSISGISTIIFTLQLQHVLPLSKSKSKAKYYFISIFSISLYIFLLFTFFSFFLTIDYKLAFLLSFFLALNSITTNFLVFNGAFTNLSIFSVIRVLIIVGLQLLFSIKRNNLFDGLVLGAIAGEIISSIYFLFKENLFSFIKINTSFKKLKYIIFQWKSYTLYGTIQELLSVMVYSLPIIFYVNKFGENIGGQYSIAYKLIWAPTVLVSSSIAQVLTNKFGVENDFSFIKNKIWFNIKFLWIIPPFFLFFIIVNYLDIDFIQNKWNIAFNLLPFMFVNALFFTFAMPYRVALRVLRKNIIILKIEAITVLLLIITFFVGNVSVIWFTFIVTTISIFQNLLIYVGFTKSER